MKKFFCFLIITFVFGFVLTSCHTTHPCPAYNNYDHYKVEDAF